MGIGTAEPSVYLDVNGNIKLSGDLALGWGKSLLIGHTSPSITATWQPQLLTHGFATDRKDYVDFYVPGNPEGVDTRQTTPVLSLLESGYVGVGSDHQYSLIM